MFAAWAAFAALMMFSVVGAAELFAAALDLAPLPALIAGALLVFLIGQVFVAAYRAEREGARSK